MGMLMGDTTADRFVNTTDINQVKTLVGQAATSSSFR
jgi:hypothetical protein